MKTKTLKDKIVEARDVVPKLPVVKKVDIKQAIKDLKEEVELLNKDYANLEICDKEDVIILINRIMGVWEE